MSKMAYFKMYATNAPNLCAPLHAHTLLSEPTAIKGFWPHNLSLSFSSNHLFAPLRRHRSSPLTYTFPLIINSNQQRESGLLCARFCDEIPFDQETATSADNRRGHAECTQEESIVGQEDWV